MSAASINAPRRRRNRFLRRKLDRPFAAAPHAARLSRNATKRCLMFADDRQRREIKPTKARSSCALMWSASRSYAERKRLSPRSDSQRRVGRWRGVLVGKVDSIDQASVSTAELSTRE